MHSNSSEILLAGNDMIVDVRGLVNEATGVFVNDADVYCTVKDANGVEVTGQTWPITLAYVTDSNGVYRGTIPYTVDLTPSARYTMTFSVDAGAGLRGAWSVPCLCR